MPARLSLALLAATIAAAVADPAGAATVGDQPATTVVAPAGSTTTAGGTATSATTSKYVSAFSSWAGSTANAQSLIDGLHAGSSITLSGATTLTTSGQTSTTVGANQLSFAPATGPMSVRQTSIALAVAQRSLAAQGISQPTPSQIEAALNGGTITVAATGSQTGSGGTAATTTIEMRGVLALRADHQGWGKIANTLGFKLGPVISGLNHTIRADRTVTTTDTASGVAADSGATSVGHGGHAYGQGIVSAGGTPLSAGYASHQGNGKSAGAMSGQSQGGSISTAMAPAAGNGMANGNGVGHGTGHGKP